MIERSWPLPTLQHVLRLTDNCGIIQHAKFWLPDYVTGYCVDDNSRALIVAHQYYHLFGDESAHELMVRYLSFMFYTQRPDGIFRNFVGYDRTYLEEIGSPDSLGRAIWGLGRLATIEEHYLAIPAREMFLHAVTHITPRAPEHTLAYALLGITRYGEREEWRAEARRFARPLATALLQRYRKTRAEGWEWFRTELTYGNARLCEALLRAGALLDDAELHEAALTTLGFLNAVSFRDGYLSLVGCKGWYPRGGEVALFDQQPIDAGGMVEVNLAAHTLTREERYFESAVRAMDWFYGRNIAELPLYNHQSGGCHDGLGEFGVNANQGAESTLVYLMAQLAFYQVEPHLFEVAIPDITADEQNVENKWSG